MEVIGIRRDKPWLAIVSYCIPTGVLKGLRMVTEVGVDEIARNERAVAKIKRDGGVANVLTNERKGSKWET